MQLLNRGVPPRSAWALEQAGVHPLMARLYAARGVISPDEIDPALSRLLPPSSLQGTAEAAQLLAQMLVDGHKLCIVADYDCDGATACSVGLRGLAMLGFQRSQLDFIVPDRVVDGYGLTPPIADRVKARGADLLVTVDNGIASIEGVAHARALGMQVLVTDHHLPAVIEGQVRLPEANVIVNPNQPGCTFPSKALAGVGVMFYVLLALRAELRAQGRFDAAQQPRLDRLLDLVTLGTVADVVKLDANNRRMVAQGLKRMREGHMQPGVAALFAAASRDPRRASTFDLGFALGPRLNAAGRLADMTLGIECLTTDDPQRAATLAQQLDTINRERRDIESQMQTRSLDLLDQLTPGVIDGNTQEVPAAIAIHAQEFHEGVVGILASRLKEQYYRPSFVFAPSHSPGSQGLIKGSGRSIPGFHLRDALDLVEKRHPGLLLRFGGHAMAAGCTLRAEDFNVFSQALATVAAEQLDADTLARRMETDGPLPVEYCRPDIAAALQAAVWGAGFAPPTFSEALQVISQRLVGEKHLALKLKYQGRLIDGIWFGHSTPLPPQAHLAYRLETDEWQGVSRVRFVIEGMEDAPHS